MPRKAPAKPRSLVLFARVPPELHHAMTLRSRKSGRSLAKETETVLTAGLAALAELETHASGEVKP